MTAFTTTVTGLFTLPQVNGQENVVVDVYYLITGIDGEHTASIQFNQQFTLSQDQAFTPYSQLTESQIVGWADPQTIANFQDCVQGQINSLANPPILPTSQSLPWLTT